MYQLHDLQISLHNKKLKDMKMDRLLQTPLKGISNNVGIVPDPPQTAAIEVQTEEVEIITDRDTEPAQPMRKGGSLPRAIPVKITPKQSQLNS